MQLYVADFEMTRAGTMAWSLPWLMAFAVPGVGHAGAPNEIDPADIVASAVRAKAAADYPMAAGLFRNALEIIAADSKYRDFSGLVMQSNMALELADMIHRGAMPAPCVQVTASRSFLDKARLLPRSKDAELERQALEEFSQMIAQRSEQLGCSAAASKRSLIDKPDLALVGHYYLSGVRETGSELMLRANGTFDWYMSYGAVDQSASGRWGRNQSTVTLASDKPARTGSLFRAEQQIPWNADAERQLRMAAYRIKLGEVGMQCPFLEAGDFVVTPPPPISPTDQPDRKTLADAQATLAQARTARDAAQIAATAAVLDGPDRDSRMEAARLAMERWAVVKFEVSEAFRQAGQPTPELTPPNLPRQCTPPKEPEDAVPPMAQWHPGIAVHLADPKKQMRFQHVAVIFRYGDGHTERLTTDRDGWAVAPSRAGQIVRQIAFAIGESARYGATLDIAPLSQGIQPVTVDTSQLVARPFDRLELILDHGKLRFADDKPGQYSRQ